MDFELLVQANLAIEDGKVVKNRFGPTGRDAEVGDYKRADIIVENKKVICNWITEELI